MATKKTVEVASEGTKVIQLQRLEDELLIAQIVGVTPVIPHKWSEKSKRMMREKQQQVGGTVRQKREAKDPEEEAESALYKLPDGRPGIPSVAYKAAMVEACRFFEGLAMTEAKRLLFVEGDGPDQLVPIIYHDRVLREDTPRNQTGVADLRYRYAFYPWSAKLRIRFPRRVISATSVIALLDAGGRNGVCDWRPGSPKSNTGTYGQFRVQDEGIA